MGTTYKTITALASRMGGLFSRSQANAVGVTDGELRRRVANGTLVRSGPHSFRLPGVTLGAAAGLRALMIDLGGEVWASGCTAAALHGYDGYHLRAPYDVVIMRGRDMQRIGHRIHTTNRLDLIDRTSIDGVPCLSGARTLIDLARTQSVEQLTVAYDSGLRDRRFTEELVHRRIVALRSSGRFGIPRLLEAIEGTEVIRGGHSWLEREFLRLVASAGLPRPETQAVLTRARDRLVRVDFRFPGTNVLVEVLGYRYHRTKDQMRRDADRLNALIADGFAPYQFTYEHVVDTPDAVVDDLCRALARSAA